MRTVYEEVTNKGQRIQVNGTEGSLSAVFEGTRCKVADRKPAMAYSSSRGGVGAKLKQIQTNTSHPPPDFHLKNTRLSGSSLASHRRLIFSVSPPPILLLSVSSFAKTRPASYPVHPNLFVYQKKKKITTVTNTFTQLNENHDETIFTRLVSESVTRQTRPAF